MARDPNERSASRSPLWPRLLAPVAAGATLRLWNLDRQILLDDEMHTVGAALYSRVGDILGAFRTEDPCLPLAAFYRTLLEAGVPFSETTFRLPVAASGLLAVIALPWLALPAIGRRAAILLAWLIAVSPVLAIYSGMVRPYAFVALLAPAAALLALRWRDIGRGGSNLAGATATPARWRGLGFGLAYAATAALCLWFHLGTAPMIAAPFGLLLVEKVVWRREAPSWRAFGLIAAAAMLLIAAFMLPAFDSLRRLYAVKSDFAPFSFELVPPIARLQAGSTTSWGAVAFWIAAASGLAALWRGRRAVAVFLGAVTLAQWVGLAILAPVGLLHPIIFNRYLIGTLPLVLVFVACGLAAVVERLGAAVERIGTPRRRAIGAATASARAGEPLEERASSGALSRSIVVIVPATLLAYLVMVGPYADPEFRRTSFRHSKDFIRFDKPRARLDDADVPAFYREATRRERGAAIAEFPFRGGWSATRAHSVYQTRHGAPVLAVEPLDWLCDERLRLRNHLCHEPAALLASEARFLVVHRDVLAEELLVEGGDSSGNQQNPQEWGEMVPIARRFARDLRLRWGAPFYRDARVAAWDLDAVRARRTAPTARARSGGR